MNVGEGRAGKTALYQAMLLNRFNTNGTKSTIGIDETTCKVVGMQIQGSGGNSSWSLVNLAERGEMEHALAEMVARPCSPSDQDNMIELMVAHSNHVQQRRDAQRVVHDQVVAKLRSNHQTQAESVLSTQRVVRQFETDSTGPTQRVMEVGRDQRPPSATTTTSRFEFEGVGKLNKDLVLYYQQNENQTSVIFSAWDYGGQDVFYCFHPLFLTRYGVYLVVFDMQWLASSASAETRQQCQNFLRFWLYSIAIHSTGQDGSTAPVFIIGTHKDHVGDPKEHEDMSKWLHDTFVHTPAWTNVRPCKEGAVSSQRVLLWFFPINNTMGHHDKSLLLLMQSIEEVAHNEEYIKKQVPFAWLRVLDAVEVWRRDAHFVSWDDMMHTATQCGLPSLGLSLEQELKYLLLYLNELGVLMWFDEPSLCHLVILDAGWLIKATTKIICDTAIHHLPEHESARKLHGDWALLVSEATLTLAMLEKLWVNIETKFHKPLLHLLVKFGLAVCLNNEREYLVPGLLKESAQDVTLTGGGYTCYLHFAMPFSTRSAKSEEQAQHNTALPPRTAMTMEMMSQEGFLPMGLFARLIGKCLSWAQSTGSTRTPLLSKTHATMDFGDDLFRISEMLSLNAVRLETNTTPDILLERMLLLIEAVLAEAYPGLRCDVWVSAKLMGDAQGSKVYSLAHIKQAVNDKSAIADSVSLSAISFAQLAEVFREWLPPSGLLERYHVFLSYRWHTFDTALVGRLFDCLRRRAVVEGTQRKRVEVFVDRYRLQSGRRFDEDFMEALRRSCVAVPVLSESALQRMLSLQESSDVDNLLLEWTLMLELHDATHRNNPNQNELLVLPLIIGRVSEVAGVPVQVGNLLHDVHPSYEISLPERMPRIVVKSVQDKVLAVLKQHGIEPSAEFRNRTVYDVVKAICVFQTDFAERIVERSPRSNASTLEMTGMHSLFADMIVETIQKAMQSIVHVEAEKAITSTVPPNASIESSNSGLGGITQWLRSLGINEEDANVYQAQLVKLGCDSVSDFGLLTQSMVEGMEGLKPVHKRKLVSQWHTAQAQSGVE
eukprot:c20031_g1_i4.p1 GENE.c20031_g1_i4~~c20031_g1_i4.p1  ORF type:complete len:1055 (+),score=191.90 c20031_g1_i4:1637-4801(+)